MSVIFSIQNPKVLFRPKRVLSVDECLALSDDLMQVDFDELANDVATSEAFYHQSLADVQCLHLTKMQCMGRGFELSFVDDAYHVRVNTPATIFDWQQALEFLQILAQHLRRPIVSERGEVFGSDDIMGFDYQSDIVMGLEQMLQDLQGAKQQFCEIQGVVHPIAFNQTMLDELLKSDNPALFFSQQMIDNQNIDGCFVSPMIVQKVHQTCGVYVVDENLPIILPYQPDSTCANGTKVDTWLIGFYALIDQECRTGNQLKKYQMPYAMFINELDGDEYEHIDAKYILVYALDRVRMYELLAKSRQMDGLGS